MGGTTLIQAGTPITFCQIQRNSHVGVGNPDAVYVVEFEFSGRRYRCRLVEFQPRTEALDLFRVEEDPAHAGVPD